MQDGFGGSMGGEQFSTIYGDLITKATINREVKVRGGPMRGGYSTSVRATDNFIKMSHMMAAIRRKLKEKLWYVTSSAHTKISAGSTSKYDNTVRDRTNQLQELFDLFLEAPARHFESGVQIEESIVDGLLKS